LIQLVFGQINQVNRIPVFFKVILGVFQPENVGFVAPALYLSSQQALYRSGKAGEVWFQKGGKSTVFLHILRIHLHLGMGSYTPPRLFHVLYHFLWEVWQPPLRRL
jgi:hypothetical protein